MIHFSSDTSVQPNTSDSRSFLTSTNTSHTVGLPQINKSCEVNMNGCAENEFCQPFGGRRRDGLCVCKEGYLRSVTSGVCELRATPSPVVVTSPVVNTAPASPSTAAPVVSAGEHNVCFLVSYINKPVKMAY